MKQERVDILQNFVQDPNWHVMEEYIKSFFDTSLDVNDINPENNSQTVQAEVIARQKISADIEEMMSDFQNLRQVKETKKQSWK